MEINKFPGTFEQARLKVADFARQHGREYGIVIGPDGTIVEEREGDAYHVDFGIRQAGEWKNHWLVHSHPNNTSLSHLDIRAAGSFSMGGVVAVTPDDSVFTATDIQVSDENWVRVQKTLAMASLVANAFLNEGFSEKDADTVGSIWMGKALHALGIIKYTVQLGSQTKPVWEAYQLLSGETDEKWEDRRSKYGTR